jgi:hypothetical protein
MRMALVGNVAGDRERPTPVALYPLYEVGQPLLRRAATTTVARSAASVFSAVASPMPLEAPVITATLATRIPLSVSGNLDKGHLTQF